MAVADAIHQAHANAAVQALWGEFGAACDYVPLASLAEAQQMFAEFDSVDLSPGAPDHSFQAAASGAASFQRWTALESPMICRMWHGVTPRSKADAYASFLEQRAVPDYRSVPGNLSAAVLRRDEAEVTHFLTVTHWASEESIRAFAGDELLKAKYYPEDQDYLLGFEPLVQHFVVAVIDDSAAKHRGGA